MGQQLQDTLAPRLEQHVLHIPLSQECRMQKAHQGAQKMSALRVEADEATAKNDELTAKIKRLEQDSLSKEQEITSLTHRNQLLESEVEKLETAVKEHKTVAEDRGRDSHQNESNQRRLQLLEDEAEEADKNLRETNEKYGFFPHLRTGVWYLALFGVANG